MIKRERLALLLLLLLVLMTSAVFAATLGETASNAADSVKGFVGNMFSDGSFFARFLTVARIVNYVIVFFLLYILASFVPGIRDQFSGWRDNRVMMSVALGGLSVFIVATGIKDPQMFLWNLAWIETLKTLFIEGRFYVFLMAGVGYYMIFNTWGGENFKKGPMKIILTVILAFETAQSGMTKESVFQGLYFIFLFALYKSFGGGEGSKTKSMALGLSFGIVNYVAITAFGQYNFGLKWAIGDMFTTNAESTFSHMTFIGNFLTGFLFGFLLSIRKSVGQKSVAFAKGIGKGTKAGWDKTKERSKKLWGSVNKDGRFSAFWQWLKSRDDVDRIKRQKKWAEKIASSKWFKNTSFGNLAKEYVAHLDRQGSAFHGAMQGDVKNLHEALRKFVPDAEEAYKFQMRLRKQFDDEAGELKHAEAVIRKEVEEMAKKEGKGKEKSGKEQKREREIKNYVDQVVKTD